MVAPEPSWECFGHPGAPPRAGAAAGVRAACAWSACTLWSVCVCVCVQVGCRVWVAAALWCTVAGRELSVRPPPRRKRSLSYGRRQPCAEPEASSCKWCRWVVLCGGDAERLSTHEGFAGVVAGRAGGPVKEARDERRAASFLSAPPRSVSRCLRHCLSPAAAGGAAWRRAAPVRAAVRAHKLARADELMDAMDGETALPHVPLVRGARARAWRLPRARAPMRRRRSRRMSQHT